MRDLDYLSKYRNRQAERKFYGRIGDSRNGMFVVPFVTMGFRSSLVVIASVWFGWEHVSVSHKARIPKWLEMDYIKRLFFEDHETAMQLHVPPADHINNCKNCLHLWRPLDVEIPRPPAILVGAAGFTKREPRARGGSL